ncbi:hypothetical protein IMSAGC016_00984 [Muribaculaceae bacterium]|nr:hypothetical protein IMSAGC016_00984 [Muribaculaceae bacterium]
MTTKFIDFKSLGCIHEICLACHFSNSNGCPVEVSRQSHILIFFSISIIQCRSYINGCFLRNRSSTLIRDFPTNNISHSHPISELFTNNTYLISNRNLIWRLFDKCIVITICQNKTVLSKSCYNHIGQTDNSFIGCSLHVFNGIVYRITEFVASLTNDDGCNTFKITSFKFNYSLARIINRIFSKIFTYRNLNFCLTGMTRGG